MVNLITGKNGKGKSKVLLEKVNSQVKEILGNIVYLDTSTKHMYELNNKIRLINASEYNISSSSSHSQAQALPISSNRASSRHINRFIFILLTGRSRWIPA